MPTRRGPAAGFQELIHEIAGLQIEYARKRGFSTQRPLRE